MDLIQNFRCLNLACSLTSSWNNAINISTIFQVSSEINVFRILDCSVIFGITYLISENILSSRVFDPVSGRSVNYVRFPSYFRCSLNVLLMRQINLMKWLMLWHGYFSVEFLKKEPLVPRNYSARYFISRPIRTIFHVLLSLDHYMALWGMKWAGISSRLEAASATVIISYFYFPYSYSVSMFILHATNILALLIHW